MCDLASSSTRREDRTKKEELFDLASSSPQGTLIWRANSALTSEYSPKNSATDESRDQRPKETLPRPKDDVQSTYTQRVTHRSPLPLLPRHLNLNQEEVVFLHHVAPEEETND